MTAQPAAARKAIFPGSFDPLTNGHLDVIRRGAPLFDELIVAVGENPEKALRLPAGERAEIITRITADLPNVTVQTYDGLTVDFARQCGASIILRGIRNSGDLQY